jgi:hypothetical protein
MMTLLGTNLPGFMKSFARFPTPSHNDDGREDEDKRTKATLERRGSNLRLRCPYG